MVPRGCAVSEVEDLPPPITAAEIVEMLETVQFYMQMMKADILLDLASLRAFLRYWDRRLEAEELSRFERYGLGTAGRKRWNVSRDRLVEQLMVTMNLMDRARAEKPDDPEYQSRMDRWQLNETHQFYKQLLELGDLGRPCE